MLSSNNNRLKIAFLTSLDPLDRTSWSGTFFSMAKAIEKHCGDVVYLGPVSINLPQYQAQLLKLISLGSHKVSRKIYNRDFSLLSSWQYAKSFEKKLMAQKVDLIFAPSGMTQIAFLKTNAPIVYLSDATIKLLERYYPAFLNFANNFEGNFLEQAAINKADLLIYSSKWAAHSAIHHYGADPNKIDVIPFGANTDNILEKEILLKRKREILLEKGHSKQCRLLFLAVDWQRKGGELAFETFLELRKLGLDAELTVCGCVPPQSIQHEKMTVIPCLNKNDKVQLSKLENLLLESDFLLLPTRADCSPIVMCEANAFGLPVVTTNTGGIAEIINNGTNGFMLPLEARGEEYAKVIYEAFKDSESYFNLVQTSRQAFEEKFNWDAWAIALNQSIVNKLFYSRGSLAVEQEV